MGKFPKSSAKLVFDFQLLRDWLRAAGEKLEIEGIDVLERFDLVSVNVDSAASTVALTFVEPQPEDDVLDAEITDDLDDLNTDELLAEAAEMIDEIRDLGYKDLAEKLAVAHDEMVALAEQEKAAERASHPVSNTGWPVFGLTVEPVIYNAKAGGIDFDGIADALRRAYNAR